MRRFMLVVGGLLLALELGLGSDEDAISSCDIQGAILIVEGDSASGTAFVAQVDGVQYIYTNAHVLSRQKSLVFSTASGKTITLPKTLEVAEACDLARVRLEGEVVENPLVLAGNATIGIGDEVVAYGNSGGESVITELEGEILGVGPSELEIDAGIIPGNSGGPILKKGTNTVLAVATRGQAESGPWATETRFEEVRRFGLRPSHAKKWKKTSFAALRREWESIEKINIDTVSIVALAVLSATRRGFYIPDDLMVGANGRVTSRSAVAPSARSASSEGRTTGVGGANASSGRTYVVKEWLQRHRRNGLTRTIWGNLGRLNRELGYGTRKPVKSMVEVQRHYASFFSPIFKAYRQDIRLNPKSYSFVHREEYEAAVSARKAACDLLLDDAKRIKQGILDTGMSGLSRRPRP